MKRIITIIFTLLILTINAPVQADDLILRGYDGVEVPTGTFIQVINLKEFSTEYCDETTEVSFMATNDTYMQEINVIPKGTVFYGMIESMHEPIIGTNASMVIKIVKMKLPDDFEIPMKGYIYTNNHNMLGGELTQPLIWKKIPHYQHGFGMGTLKYVPGEQRKMGEHLTVTSGANLLIVLSAPAWITHTLTN